MKLTNSTYLIVFYFFSMLVSSTCFASKGGVNFTIEAINQNPVNFTWSIVVPNFHIKENSFLWLSDENGQEINAEFYITALWQHDSEVSYIRSLVIKSYQPVFENSKYSLQWRIKHSNIKTEPLPQLPMTFNAQLSDDWLSKTFYAPMSSFKENQIAPWFDEAYQGYGRYVSEIVYKTNRQSNDSNRASIWLYDRTLALYLLYMKTGNLKWKRDAHDSAIFYQDHLDEQGGFTLKSGDMKYSNSQGLLFDYLFYPEQRTKRNIYLLYKKSLSWPTAIQKEGFWTERHHSIALTSAISYWLLTGDISASKRVKRFIDEMTSYIIDPVNQSCLKHTFKAHEGWNLATDVCSPWMSALIIEQLWRYHHLTLSYNSLALIEKLTGFLIGTATYNYNFTKEETAIPKYLVYLSPDLTEKEDPWMSYQHACDVASAIAKGAYAQKLLSKENKKTIETLNLMIRSCYRSLYRSHGDKAWPIAPIRKFNWWFSSSGSFTWLLKYHGVTYTPRYNP